MKWLCLWKWKCVKCNEEVLQWSWYWWYYLKWEKVFWEEERRWVPFSVWALGKYLTSEKRKYSIGGYLPVPDREDDLVFSILFSTEHIYIVYSLFITVSICDMLSVCYLLLSHCYSLFWNAMQYSGGGCGCLGGVGWPEKREREKKLLCEKKNSWKLVEK